MFARFFAAVVVVGGRGGTVCACVLLLAAVFLLCPPLVLDRSGTKVRREAGCITWWTRLWRSAPMQQPCVLSKLMPHARCAEAGLSATASAYAGALSAFLGSPSGVASDATPQTALAILSGRQEAADKHAAERLRDSVRALLAPPGSVRLYVP